MHKHHKPKHLELKHHKIGANTAQTEFKDAVIANVNAIPFGKVATYGQIAERSGNKKAPRQVGIILKYLPKESTIPWHRVVNSKGEISLTGANYQRQKSALIAEGVSFKRIGEHERINPTCFID